MGEDQLESRTGFDLPVVHHLAAKSLLSDWKAGKGWGSTALTHEREQESTNLSIESSVICEHTAFVAIDEEQNKPIEGAITLHDITATMIQPRNLGGGGGGGGRGGHGGFRFGGFSAFSSVDQSLSTVDQKKKKMKDNEPRMYYRLAKTVGAPVAAPSRSPVRKSKPRRASPEMSDPLAFQDFKFRCAMECDESLSVDQYKSSKIPLSKSLTTLISLQHATGYWLLKDISEKIVKKSESEMQCPPNISKEAWATIVALVFLECKYSEQKDEWELVALKAEMWLSSQTLSSSIESLKEMAKTVI